MPATSMMFLCSALSPWACSPSSTAAAGALLIVAVGLRAGWLGLATARAVRALALAPTPLALAQAARRCTTTRISCLDSRERVAFCAGLYRPRVYVSLGLVATLAGDELVAVLAHENAHARRRDPLRGLLMRACADVAFFAPLLRWCQHRRHLRAELAADRAAVEHTSAPALAGALLRLADSTPAETPAGAATFGAAAAVLERRIAALTAATPAPRQPLPTHAGIMSIAGLIAVGVVVACLPALVAMLG